MKKHDVFAIRRKPAHSVSGGRSRSAVASPQDDQRQAKTLRQRRQGAWVAERIRAVEHRRRFGLMASQHAAAGEQVPDQRLAAGNELVGQHVPRTGLQSPVTKECRERDCAIGAHVEIVLDDDCLAVEQKTLLRRGRVVDELIDQRDQPLPESLGGMIPLTIPVCVRNDVRFESHRGSRNCALRTRRRSAKRPRRYSPRPSVLRK
jgi:hypothetical protein